MPDKVSFDTVTEAEWTSQQAKLIEIREATKRVEANTNLILEKLGTAPPIEVPDPIYEVGDVVYLTIASGDQARVWTAVERTNDDYRFSNTFLPQYNGVYEGPQWLYTLAASWKLPEKVVLGMLTDGILVDKKPTEPPVEPPVGDGKFEIVGPNIVLDTAGHVDSSPDGWVDTSSAFLRHWGDKGCNVARLMTRQMNFHNIGEPFHADYVRYIKSLITRIYESGCQVYIEPHDFGRRWHNGHVYELGEGPFSFEAFANFWRMMAETFSEFPGVWGLELDNEPYDLGIRISGLTEAYQMCINAIREVNSSIPIIIPLYHWSNADKAYSHSDMLKTLTDPSDNLIFDGHNYLDPNQRGEYNSGMSPMNIGITRFEPFCKWLRENKLVGIVGEIGCPNTTEWLTRYKIALDLLSEYPEILGVNQWAAGIWGPSYPNNINPVNGEDRTNMKMLLQYKA